MIDRGSSAEKVVVRGLKRRFLLYGAVNVFVTNICLQGLLLLVPIALATMFSQLVNLGLGYVLYGKAVFRVARFTRRSAGAYAVLASLLWWLNWFGITVLVGHGFGKNLSAILMIPILPVISYSIQKALIFR
jgi:hypothetical protein